MTRRNIVVIGGSSGALEALLELLSPLPADFPAAIFVVIHTSPDSPGMMPQILNRGGSLRARYPHDGETFTPGRIYVAPPDRHLLVKRDHVRVTRGPRENRFRPSIDPLFRTAAVAHLNRVVAVVLSGGGDDGAVGAAVVKHRGGVVIVQDPATALVPSMPEAALRHVRTDRTAPAANLADVLRELVAEEIAEREEEMSKELPRDVAEIGRHRIHQVAASDSASPFTCPECGGTLWQSQDRDLMQFECHVGHRFSGEALVGAQDEALDHALWSGLRALEEKTELRRRMAAHARGRGMTTIATSYDEQAEESELRASLIRRVLMPEAAAESEPVSAAVSRRPRPD